MLDNEIFSKYENEFIKCLDKENIVKIVKFLQSEKVDYIDELLTNYLELFLIEYEEFKNKFIKLKNIYGNDLVEKIANDLTILEEF